MRGRLAPSFFNQIKLVKIMSKTAHFLKSGNKITLTATDSVATIHRIDDRSIGKILSSGSVTFGPYYFDTEWETDGGTAVVAQTERIVGDIPGIAIDEDSSVSGNIYESGIVHDGCIYSLTNTYDGVGDPGAEGIFYVSGNSFVDAEGNSLAPDFNEGVNDAPQFSAPVVDTESTITSHATWTNYPTAYDYEWYFKPTGGSYSLVSTAESYTPTQVGLLKVRVRAKNGYGYLTVTDNHTENGFRESGEQSVTEE